MPCFHRLQACCWGLSFCLLHCVHGKLMEMSKRKQINGDEPATQRDLSLLGGNLTTKLDGIKGQLSSVNSRLDSMDGRLDGVDSRLDRLDSRLEGVDSRLDSLESGQAAILKVVNSIDEQLKEWKKIPAKVDRLHKRVFGSHQ